MILTKLTSSIQWSNLRANDSHQNACVLLIQPTAVLFGTAISAEMTHSTNTCC